MSSWRELSLEEFAHVNPRESLSKGFTAKKFPMDVLGEFKRSLGSFEIEEYKGGAKFKNGDTLLARITPCLQNGKTAFVDVLEENEIAFGSTEYIVLREKDGVSNKLFLYYLSISPNLRRVAIKSMTGSSGRQRVQTDVLKNHIFNLPPLPEQKAITHILGKLDDKIELNRQMNKTLEDMAQALFKSWFVDFDPVLDNALAAGNEIPETLQVKAERRKQVPDTKKLITRNPKLAALFPASFTFNETLDKWIPEGWEVKRLEVIGVSIRDNINQDEINDSDIYVGLEHIGRKQIFLTDNGLGIDVSSNKSLFIKGDVLFGKLRPYFHKVCISPSDGICSTDIIVFRAKEEYLSSFFTMLLFQEKLVKYSNIRSTGTRMPRANQKDILDYETVIAPTEILKEYDSQAGKLFRKGLQSVQQTETLTKLRDTLLPHLISGKVRVPEKLLTLIKMTK